MARWMKVGWRSVVVVVVGWGRLGERKCFRVSVREEYGCFESKVLELLAVFTQLVPFV